MSSTKCPVCGSSLAYLGDFAFWCSTCKDGWGWEELLLYETKKLGEEE